MGATLAEQIEHAYALDRERKPQAVGPDDIPVSYEAITDAWLTAILCAGVPGAAVLGHRLEAPDSGTSNRRRIHLSYNDAGVAAGLPASVFCKATFELANRMILGHSGGIHSEVTFYKRARPLLDIEAPRCFYAAYDPHSFASLVMLADLGEEVHFCNHDTPVDRARIESQLDLLASLHSRFFQSPLLDTDLGPLFTWHQRFHNLERFKLRECCEQGVLDAESIIPARLFARRDEIWPRTLDSVERHLSLPHSLTHGDVHLKNWYITGDGAMGLGDWQVTSKGHWSRDFAYTISTALKPADRRAWERELLAYYLERLAAAGGERINLDAAMVHYRQQLLSALAWWTLTLAPASDMPDMQPRETSITFIRRIAQAIDDLDALDSFK